MKIDLFRNKSDTRLFTLFFSLTLLVRPVEGIIFLVPVLLLFTWKNYSNYVTAREILREHFYILYFLYGYYLLVEYFQVSSSVIKIDPPNSLNIFINLTMIISLLLFFNFNMFANIGIKIFYTRNLNKISLKEVYFSRPSFYGYGIHQDLEVSTDGFMTHQSEIHLII